LKSETSPNDQNDRNSKKLSQAAARPVRVIIILNIRICLDFGASDLEFGSGLSRLGVPAPQNTPAPKQPDTDLALD
jgi:hypothetical protein